MLEALLEERQPHLPQGVSETDDSWPQVAYLSSICHPELLSSVSLNDKDCRFWVLDTVETGHGNRTLTQGRQHEGRLFVLMNLDTFKLLLTYFINALRYLCHPVPSSGLFPHCFSGTWSIHWSPHFHSKRLFCWECHFAYLNTSLPENLGLAKILSPLWSFPERFWISYTNENSVLTLLPNPREQQWSPEHLSAKKDAEAA